MHIYNNYFSCSISVLFISGNLFYLMNFCCIGFCVYDFGYICEKENV